MKNIVLAVKKNRDLLRMSNLLFSFFFNICFLYIVFKFSSEKGIEIFAKGDIFLTATSLMLTLGLERVFIFDQDVSERECKIIYSSVSIIIIISIIIITALNLFFPLSLLFVPFLPGIYAFSNLSLAISQKSRDYDQFFLSISIFKVFFLLILWGILHYQLIKLDNVNLIIICATCLFAIIAFNFNKIFLSEQNICKVIRNHIGKSQYILYMTVVGVFHANLPRIYEMYFGDITKSVSYFFWFRVAGYIGALGFFFTFWIQRHMIFEKSKDSTLKNAFFGSLLIIILLLLLGMINNSKIQFIQQFRTSKLTLVLVSVSILFGYLRDLYIENRLSLMANFRKRFIDFLSVFILVCISMFICKRLNMLDSDTVLIIYASSSFYWLIVGVVHAWQYSVKIIYHCLILVLIYFLGAILLF